MIRRLVPIALVSMGAFAAGFPEAASVYNAGLYSQVPLTDVSDANRATFIADAKAAGIDAVWISVVDFFEEEARRKPVLDHLATEIRHFEAAGFAVGVWINAFGYGNERPFFKDSMKITTLEGKAKGGAVCPLDPKLRRALVDNVRDIARAGAKFILMDDDYVQSARGLVGCSCPNHLARVAAKCGRTAVTCEDVKAAFTGAPNAVRTAYLDVTGEVAVELARELRRVVDEVNPAVGMGFCASYTHWDVEGCDLLELVGAFAGKGRKVLRISGAPYWANSKLPGTGLADIIEFVRMQSAWTRGLDMTVFDENDPYPRKVARALLWRRPCGAGLSGGASRGHAGRREAAPDLRGNGTVRREGGVSAASFAHGDVADAVRGRALHHGTLLAARRRVRAAPQGDSDAVRRAGGVRRAAGGDRPRDAGRLPDRPLRSREGRVRRAPRKHGRIAGGRQDRHEGHAAHPLQPARGVRGRFRRPRSRRPAAPRLRGRAILIIGSGQAVI